MFLLWIPYQVRNDKQVFNPRPFSLGLERLRRGNTSHDEFGVLLAAVDFPLAVCRTFKTVLSVFPHTGTVAAASRPLSTRGWQENITFIILGRP
jgi:hypothetical protein